MTIYIIVTLAIVLVGVVFKVNKTKKRQKYFLFFAFSLLAIISSLRSYNVGIDTLQFYENYVRYNIYDWSQFDLVRYEFGFFALYKILNMISPEPQLLIIVTSLFICFAVGRFIYKNSYDVLMATFLFITLNVFFNYMNIMRQAIGVCIIILAIELLKKPNAKNIILYSLFVILAMQFHISLFIMFLPLIFIKIPYKNMAFIVTIIGAVVAFATTHLLWSIGVEFAFFENYVDYGSNEHGESNYVAGLLNFAVCFVILMFGLFISRNQTKTTLSKHYAQKNVLSFSLNAYLVSFCLIFFAMAMQMIVLQRIAISFQIFYITWISNTLALETSKRDKTIFTYVIMLATMGYFFVIGIFRPEWYGTIPYEFFFEAQTIVYV